MMGSSSEPRKKSTGNHPDSDNILSDQRLYEELIDSNLFEASDSREMSRREMSSLFENRSISEVAKYPTKNNYHNPHPQPTTLENLRNASNTTVGVHEI